MGLFNPARMSDDKEKALSEVVKLPDQSVLAQVAKEEIHQDIARVALEKLTEQLYIIDVARNAFCRDIRIAATKMITDSVEREKITQRNCSERIHDWAQIDTKHYVHDTNQSTYAILKCKHCGEKKEEKISEADF